MMESEATKLYGECAYILDKICEKCDSMEGGWDDLINYLAEIDDTQFETERDYYYYYYKFVSRIWWRIRNWSEPQAFNQVSKKEVAVNREGKVKYVDGFSIWNYDYKMFMWAMNRKFTYGMNPSMIDVPADELTPAELRRFEKRAEEKNE